jgi:hypothetical protein
MQIYQNECYNRMWTDELHRVQITKVEIREWDGANLVEGWMRADTPKALETYPRPVDVQFSAAIPAGMPYMDFHGVCTDMFYKIQNGESLVGLDYTPPPAPPVQAQANSGGLALGLLGLVCIGIAASRN